MSEYTSLLYREERNIAWVTLNRPDTLNSIDLTLQNELERVWTHVRDEPNVHCVVLSGAGDRAFCSGADRSAMSNPRGVDGEPADAARRARRGAVPGSPGFESDLERIGPKTMRCWKPVIAAVNGIACAGAFYLLGESDIIIASANATFFDPHVTYGMVSAYETIHMARRMPFGEALRMQLMGSYERLSAMRAHQIGLVSEVVEPDQLAERAGWIASSIAAQSPSAIQGTLRAAWASMEMSRSVALELSPHFIGMAKMDDWKAGQQSFGRGNRIEWQLR